MPTLNYIPRKIFEKHGLDHCLADEAAVTSLADPPVEALESSSDQSIYDADNDYSNLGDYKVSVEAGTLKPRGGRVCTAMTLDSQRESVLTADSSSENNSGHRTGLRGNAKVHQMEIKLTKEYGAMDAKNPDEKIDSFSSGTQMDAVVSKPNDQINTRPSERK